MKIEVNKIDEAQVRSLPDGKFGFGRVFTNHMLTRSYADETGWEDAVIQPYGPIPMHLSTSVFHYAQEIFEGT
ncbi:MAG: branched chain amino acid aminotransferase, partial [Chloroflexota bacterium]